MKRFLIFFTLLFCYQSLIWSQVPPRPEPQRLVNLFLKNPDAFLSTTERAQLEKRLETFSNETSNQICIVAMDDFNGYSAMDLATQIGNTWGVGQSDFKNGIIILIDPTGGDGQRDLAIAVGYGLEGAIPDLATKHIRERLIIPDFKQGLYFSGLSKGIDELSGLAKGEFSAKRYKKKNGGGTALLIIIIVIILLIAISRGNGGGGYTYNRGGRSIWWGGYNGGGGGFGGFGGSGSSGGGFGGFGGGSFGGGGSSGKW